MSAGFTLRRKGSPPKCTYQQYSPIGLIQNPLELPLEFVTWAIELVPVAGFFTSYIIPSGTSFRGLLCSLGIGAIGLYGC